MSVKYVVDGVGFNQLAKCLMLPRERVIAVINHEKPDRIPVYAWLSNLRDPLVERFGSVEAFEDRYEFDFAHLFGKLDVLEREIRRVFGMFADGGLLYCTTHRVQAHCSVDELVFAFDLVRELAGSGGAAR